MKTLLAIAVLLAATPSAQASPFVPATDDVVLETLPAAAEDGDLQELRDALSRRPHDLESARKLAWRYLELGRETGDPRYSGWAMGTLRPWLANETPAPDALLVRAIVRQNSHRFDEALADLEQVLRVRPRDARAWLVRATVLQVRGDLAGARQSCLPLVRLTDPIVSTTCLARVGSMSGGAQRSASRLRAAVATASDVDPSLLGFALTTLAEISAQLGRLDEAERHYREALELDGSDLYLRGAYADFLLDRGRADEALALCVGNADGMQLRRLLARMTLGRVPTSASVESLRARFAAARARGNPIHLGEESRFTLYVLRDPATALELAQRNFETQREARDVRAVLEAAIAARDPEAAAPALEFLAHSRFEDFTLDRLTAELERL